MRTLLVALAAANLIFFAFSQGWLDGVGGIDSLGGREPGRLALQVRPDSVRLLPMPEAASGPKDSTASLGATPPMPASTLATPR